MRTHDQTRRRFLTMMGLGAASLAVPGRAGSAKQPGRKRPPNFLLIVSDDQGYNDLGCYGSEEVKTPQDRRLYYQTGLRGLGSDGHHYPKKGLSEEDTRALLEYLKTL